MKTSTDLHEVKNNLVEFTWGEVIKFYEIEEYTIASFYQKSGNTKELLFHAWVDKKSVDTNFNSLEKAIVGAIAFKQEGYIGVAAHYFMKMIR